MSKHIELLKKLNALAKDGVGGEKINAQEMLDRLMLKHNITYREIEDDIVLNHEFKIKGTSKHYDVLMQQVFYSIIGNIDENKGVYTMGGKTLRLLRCTDAEFLEFVAKYKFYIKIYEEELSRFLNAFIVANNIYPPEYLTNLSEDKKIDIEEAKKIVALSNGLTENKWLKQIGGGNE